MELIEVINQIDLLKAELDALRPFSEETEARIWQKIRLNWNFHSNNLEGNSLTFGETKNLLLFGNTADGKPLKDHYEITGHNEAIEEVMEVLKQDRPLTETFLRQLHIVILKEPYKKDSINSEGVKGKRTIRVGEYKRQPNHVKTQTGEIFYFASPEETPAKMEELINWFRAAVEDNSYHPLLLAAELHYRFIRIHPFDDGNGRLSRLLMNFALMMKGFPPVIVKTQDKENYFRALQKADSGDLEGFIAYIGEQLLAVLELFLKGAKGEEISDEDDIDKMLKLLKAKIVGNELVNRNPVERDLLNQYEFWVRNIKPLILKVIDRIKDINVMFQHFFIKVDSSDDSFPGTYSSKNLVEYLENYFKSHIVSSIFNIHFIFKGYNFSDHQVDSLQASLNFEFDNYKFLINKVLKNQSRIMKFYNEDITNQEIN